MIVMLPFESRHEWILFDGPAERAVDVRHAAVAAAVASIRKSRVRRMILSPSVFDRSLDAGPTAPRVAAYGRDGEDQALCRENPSSEGCGPEQPVRGTGATHAARCGWPASASLLHLAAGGRLCP